MADFLTRLAERTLGVAPVVQPLVAPMFASEPANHSLDLEWDSEATTSSGDPDWAQAPSAEETSPAWDGQTGRTKDAAMAQKRDLRNLSPVPPAPPQGMPDPQPGQHQLAESASAERRVVSTQEDQQRNSPSVTPRRLPRTPDPQSEPPHLTEAASAEREMLTAPEDRQNSPAEEDQQDVFYDPPSRSQETSGRPEPLHPVESDPIWRDGATVISPQAPHAHSPPTP